MFCRRTFLSLPLCASLRAASEPLFDGTSLKRFRTPSGELPPGTSWKIENGAVISRLDVPRQCDLWSAECYAQFDLTFGWKLAPGANSGIKYLVQTWEVDRVQRPTGELVHENSIGFEFQLIDDASPDGMHSPSSCSGALYGFLAPSEKAAKPAGAWNTGRLRVRGGEVEHWLNGRRVLVYRPDSPKLQAMLAARAAAGSLSSRILSQDLKLSTPIALQHHQSEICFRDMRIERLDA